jgi:hypothetical protein
MKSSHAREYACVLALTLAQSAHAGNPGEALGYAILFVAAVNLLFYAAAVVCVAVGLALLRRKRAIAITLIVLAALPFLHYAAVVTLAQFEPGRRNDEIAKLMQGRVPAGHPPRAVEMMNAFHDHAVETLVAVGALDEVQSFNPYTKKTIVYTLRSGPECLDFEHSGGTPAELRRIVLARYAFQRCVGESEREGPANAPVQLFSDDHAPSRYTGLACQEGTFHYTLELRWAPERGAGLFAFWESRSYTRYAFPPLVLPYRHMWQCENLDWNGPDVELEDGFEFVAAALGYRSVEDFPRSPDPASAPRALRLLIPRMESQYAHDDILALLGQWPSTPAIEAALGDERLVERSAYIVRKAAALLADPREDERRQRLYPHLSMHVPALLRICSHRASHYDFQEPCAKLAVMSKRAAPPMNAWNFPPRIAYKRGGFEVGRQYGRSMYGRNSLPCQECWLLQRETTHERPSQGTPLQSARAHGLREHHAPVGSRGARERRARWPRAR